MQFYKIFKQVLPFILLFTISTSGFAQKPAIIEFGWDYPTVNILSQRLDSMQHTPFDGICFSLQKKFADLLDTTTYTTGYFEYTKLKSLKWGKYKNNYLILRAQGKRGAGWFDDSAWVSRLKNMKGISKAIFTGKIKGVLLDAEYYTENPLDNPWTYTTEQYPHHSFEEVQDQVRKRGTQFIKALQQYTSNFSILSIWISSLIMDDEKVMPYQKTRHALLPHFIEGVLLGKTKGVQVIDGNELAYWNMKPSQFIESPDLIQKTTVRLMKTAKGRALAKTIQVSQPVFYDGLMVLHPRFNLGSESNLRWNWLEENIKHAVATSTSNVVWFYNERVDWWNGTINDTLVNILEHCKDGFTKVAQAKPTALKISKYHNVNAGKGHFYSTDNKKPMQAGEPAFLYTWNNKSKQLKLTYPEKIPAGVTVFVNGVLSATIKPMAASDTVKLKTFTKGVIAVLAKYNDGKEASGFLSN